MSASRPRGRVADRPAHPARARAVRRRARRSCSASRSCCCSGGRRGSAGRRPGGRCPPGCSGCSTAPPCGAACRPWPSPSPCFVTVVAVAGPDETARNLAPWALYVTFWVGLVPASLLLGPVWRVVNPLRLLHRGLRAVLPAAPGAGRLPALGLWPAAVSLLVFLWLELVYPDRAEPATVAVFLIGYAVVQLGAVAVVRRAVVRPRRRLRGLLHADRPALPVGTTRRRPARAAQPAGQRDGGAARVRAWPRSSSCCSGRRRSTACPARCSGRPGRARRTTACPAPSACW